MDYPDCPFLLKMLLRIILCNGFVAWMVIDATELLFFQVHQAAVLTLRVAGIPKVAILFRAEHLMLTSTCCCTILREMSLSPNTVLSRNMADSAILRRWYAAFFFHCFLATFLICRMALSLGNSLPAVLPCWVILAPLRGGITGCRPFPCSDRSTGTDHPFGFHPHNTNAVLLHQPSRFAANLFALRLGCIPSNW